MEQQDPDWGLIGNNFTPRFLHGIKIEADRVPHPDRLEDRTRGFAKLGRLSGGRVVRRARRGEGKDARRIFSTFEHHDVLLMPVTGEPAIEVGRWEGDGALKTVLGMSRTYPYTGPWNHLGNPAASVPVGFTKIRSPARRSDRRPPERRGDAAVAGGPARGGAALGRRSAAGVYERLCRERGMCRWSL